MIYNETLTVLRPSRVINETNDEEADWTNLAARVEVSNVSVQPAYEREPGGENRSLVVTGWQVISGRGVDVDVVSSDRVELADGTVCEVEGEVARWPNPMTGLLDHVEFALTRAVG